MTFNNKAVMVGGFATAICIISGLAQPKYSPTITERWGEEGYELISSINKGNEIWKDRAALYKKNVKDLLLNELPIESVDENGEKIKQKCEEYKIKKVRLKNIGETNFKKISVLCTLNIKEYIELNLKEKEVLMSDANSIIDWKANFKKYEREINKDFNGITEDKQQEVLSSFCNNSFKLQHNNKNRDERLKADLWCVKREEKTE